MAKAANKSVRTRPARAAAPTGPVAAIGEAIVDGVGQLLADYVAKIDWAGIADEAKTLAEKHLADFADVVRTNLDELGLPDGGDATEDEALPETPPKGKKRVTVTGPKDGRWRAGLHFTAEPRTVDVDAGQLAQLKADPRLTVAAPAA